MLRNFLHALASGVTAVLGGSGNERSDPHDDFEHVGETVDSSTNTSLADASVAEEATAIGCHNTSGTCVDSKRRKISHVEEVCHTDEAWEKVETENRSQVLVQPEADPRNVNSNAASTPSIIQDMSLIGSQSELCTSALGNQSELSTSAFEEIQVPQKGNEDQHPDLNSSGSIEVISTETVSEVKVSMTDTLVITDSMILNSANDISSEKERDKLAKDSDTKTVEEEEIFEDSFENLEFLMEAAGHSEAVKSKSTEHIKATKSKGENVAKFQEKDEAESEDVHVVNSQDENAAEKKGTKKDERIDQKKDERKPNRSDRESHKPVILWEEGEHYLDFVKRKTEARQLIFAKKFIYKLGYLTDITTAQLEEAVVEQYKIAADKKCTDWIKECRYHGELLFSRKWLDENVPVPGRKGKTEWKQRKNRSTHRSEWSYKPGEMCRDVRLETNPNLPVYRANAASKSENSEDTKEDTKGEFPQNQLESAKEDIDNSSEKNESSSENKETFSEKKETLKEISADGEKASEAKFSEKELATTTSTKVDEKRSEESEGERKTKAAVKVICDNENLRSAAQCAKEKTESTGSVEKGLNVDENVNNNCDGKMPENIKDKGRLTEECPMGVAVKNSESKVAENELVCSKEEEKQSEISAGNSSAEELKKDGTENKRRVPDVWKSDHGGNRKEASEYSTKDDDEKEQNDLEQSDNCKSEDEKNVDEKQELDKAKWDEAMDGWIQATRKGRKARSRGVSENDGQLVSHYVTASGDGSKYSSSSENVSNTVTDYESLLADWKKDSEKHQLKKRNSDSGEETVLKTPTSAEKKSRTFISKTINSPNSPISYAAAVTGDSPPEVVRESKKLTKEGGEDNSTPPVITTGHVSDNDIDTYKEETGTRTSSNMNANAGKGEMLEKVDSLGPIAGTTLIDDCSKGKESGSVEKVEVGELDISDAEREVSKLVNEITAKVLSGTETENSAHEEEILCENTNKEDSKDIPFEDSAIISGARELSKASEGMSLPIVSLERSVEESERSNSPEEFISLLQQVMPNVSLLSGMKLEHAIDPTQEPMSKVVVQEDMTNSVDIGDISVAENVEVGEDGTSKAGIVVVEKAAEELGKEEPDLEDCSSPGVILSSEMHHYGKMESGAKSVDSKTGNSRTRHVSKNDGKQSSKKKDKINTSSGKISSAHGSGVSHVPVPHGKSSKVSYTPGKGGSQRKPSAAYEERGKRRETESLRKYSGSKDQATSSGKSNSVAREETRSRNRSGECSSKYASGIAKSDALRKKSSSSADRAKEGKERKDSLKGRSGNDYPGSPHLKSTFSSRMKTKDGTDKQSNSTNTVNQSPVVDKMEQKVAKEIPPKEDQKKVNAKEKSQHTSSKLSTEKKSYAKDSSGISERRIVHEENDDRKKNQAADKKPGSGECFVKLEKLSTQTVDEYTRGKENKDVETTQMNKDCTETSEKELVSRDVPRRRSDPLVEKFPLETILNVSNLIEMIKEKKDEISLIKHGYGQRITGGKMMRKKSVSESELDTVFGRMKKKGDLNIRRSSISTAFSKSLKELKQSVNIGKKSEAYGLHKKRGSLLYTLEQDFGSTLYEVKTAKDLVKHKEDLKEETNVVERQEGLGRFMPGFHEYNLSLECQNAAGRDVNVQDEKLKGEMKEHTREHCAKTDINSNRLKGETPCEGHDKDNVVTPSNEKDNPDIATDRPKSKSKTSSKAKTATSSSGPKAKVTNVKASRKHQWRQSKK